MPTEKIANATTPCRYFEVKKYDRWFNREISLSLADRYVNLLVKFWSDVQRD